MQGQVWGRSTANWLGSTHRGYWGRLLGDHEADFWVSGNHKHRGQFQKGLSPDRILGISTRPPAGMTEAASLGC